MMPSITKNNHIVPHEDDVLLGRAADIFHHPGNARYRHMITMNLHEFQQCQDKIDKLKFIKEITLQILDNGRVRFLKKIEKYEWKEVSFRMAFTKVSHALRDGVKKTAFPTVKPMIQPTTQPKKTPMPARPTQPRLVTDSSSASVPVPFLPAELERQQQGQLNPSALLVEQRLNSLLQGIRYNDQTRAMLSRNLFSPLSHSPPTVGALGRGTGLLQNARSPEVIVLVVPRSI